MKYINYLFSFCLVFLFHSHSRIYAQENKLLPRELLALEYSNT